MVINRLWISLQLINYTILLRNPEKSWGRRFISPEWGKKKRNRSCAVNRWLSRVKPVLQHIKLPGPDAIFKKRRDGIPLAFGCRGRGICNSFFNYRLFAKRRWQTGLTCFYEGGGTGGEICSFHIHLIDTRTCKQVVEYQKKCAKNFPFRSATAHLILSNQ